MGMYDSVWLDIKCPHCGNESEIECQTKQLECNLDVWRKGDFVTNEFNYLTCLADCLSRECTDWQNKDSGYVSGFGRMFYVKIFLLNGNVSGIYEVIPSEMDI